MAAKKCDVQPDAGIDTRQAVPLPNELKTSQLGVGESAFKSPAETCSGPKESGEFIRKGNGPYGIVPFALLEYRALTPLARLVAAWILSKPAGWIVRPAVLQAALGISEKQWLTARKQMIDVEIFRHKKHRRPDGTWFWKSEFDAAPILSTTPPKAMRGETANLEVRDIEIRISKQKTVDLGTCVPTPLPPVSNKKSPNSADLNELKRLHIGFVLNDLEIEWDESGGYVYWSDKFRAKKADDGHWVFVEVDSRGDIYDCGSAIDLIISDTGCSTADAIYRLRRIYQNAMPEAANESSRGNEQRRCRGFE